MATPHYAYLKMKIPGPKGIITVPGDYNKLVEFAHASSRLGEALVIAEERRQLDRLVAQATKKPAAKAPAKSTATAKTTAAKKTTAKKATAKKAPAKKATAKKAPARKSTSRTTTAKKATARKR